MLTAEEGASVPAAAIRPLASGAALGAASRLVVAVAGGGATILIARLLGPSASGSYFLAQSVLLLLVVVATLGVEHGVVYFVSSAEWEPPDAWRKVSKMALLFGLLGAGVALALRVALPSAFPGLSVGLTATVDRKSVV